MQVERRGAPADGGDDGHARELSRGPDDLISNFEHDNSLAPVGGRQGGWYTYGDDIGTFLTGGRTASTSIDEGNPSCSPNGALHIKGMGFAMWGAATGVDWRPRPADGDGGYGDKMTYDASPYRGIAFWAKSSAPLDGVQVSFPDLYTDGGARRTTCRIRPTPPAAALHGLHVHLQRGLPATTAARTWCSSA